MFRSTGHFMAMSSSDDASLLIRCTQTNDSQALDELAARYVNFIYAVALRQTKNDAAMAADVTQAVLLVLARRGGSVRPDRLPAWLHRVTVYAAKNACRGEARRRRHERAAAAERQEAVMPADDTESVHDLLAPVLDHAIASLSTADRGIVIERYLCGREVEEIAQQVGASTATTRKRLERAVKRLRDYFRRHRIVLSGVGIPWPALRSAPPGIAKSVVQFPIANHPLAGKIMAHLFWSKIASIAAITIFAVVAATGGVEVTRLALGENTSQMSSSAPAPLIAHLSQGVTVSIAAIADNDDPQTMWQADGSPAGAQDWLLSPNARFPGKPHSKRVILNIQGDGTGEPPVLTEFRFDGSPGADNGLVLQPTAGKSIVGLTGLLKSFPLDHDTATIWLSAGVGKFSPVMPAPMKMSWGNADGTSYSGHTPWGPYVIGKPFLRNGVVAVTISSTLGNSPLQTQWVAQTIDNGQVVRHVGHIVDGTSSDALAQEIFAFDFADPKAITSIGLETRPVEWAQFENVSLRMNSLTHVKVSTSPLKAEKN